MLLSYNKYDSGKWDFQEAFNEVDLSTKYFNTPIDIDLITKEGRKKYIQDIGSEIKYYTPSSDKKGMKKFTSALSKGVASSVLGAKGLLEPTDSIGLWMVEKLEEYDVPAKVLQYWASKDDEGRFSVLQERAKINLNASDLRSAVDYSKMANVKTLFEKLYVLVFDFGEITTGQDYYDAYPLNAGAGVSSARSVIEVNTYIYKVDMDDQTFERVKMKFDSGDFSSLDLTMKYVGRYLTVAQDGNINDDIRDVNGVMKPEFMGIEPEKRLAQKAYDEIIEIAEMRIEDFKVRTEVTDAFVGRIKAEIGKKENLKKDQRYFVYEYEEDANGNIEAKLKGVVRVGAHIADNLDATSLASETPKTVFNQIYGDLLRPGMFMVQENDFGLGMSAGVVTRTGLNLNFRLEYNISKWLDKVWKNSPLVGTMVYADLYPARVTLSDSDSEISIQMGIGISSKFYVHKYFNPEPFVGMYIGSEGGDRGFYYYNLGLRSAFPLSYDKYIVPEIGVSTSGSRDDYSPLHIGVSFRYDM